MENNVVTLDTAKKLKAAGFPQETWFGYWHDAVEWRLVWDTPKEIAAPTAQEIADQLPITQQLDGGTGYLQCGPCARPRRDWWAAYETPMGPEIQETGPTLAEALAALWLRFHETSTSGDGLAGQEGTLS